MLRCPYAQFLQTDPRPMWFYSEEKESQTPRDRIITWKPYDCSISDHIEADYYFKRGTSSISNKVINFQTMTEAQSNGDIRKVLRGTWFFKGDDKSMTPYTTDLSDIMEEEFKKGNFQKIEITSRPARDVFMHADFSFKQYRRTKSQGREVERGYKRGILRIVPGYNVPPHTQTFRVNLDVLMTHPMNANHRLPLIFERCITVLMEQGPETEGIFRLSGAVGMIDEIKRIWDSGYEVDLRNYDVNDVAGILKLFIRELPDPICKRDLCKSWTSINVPYPTERDKVPSCLEQIKLVMSQLPNINLEMFKELFRLLRKIADAKEINKMVASNLSVCWSPNLFPTENFNQAQMLTTIMIDNAQELFQY